MLSLTEVIISKKYIYIITPKLERELTDYLKQNTWDILISNRFNTFTSACLTANLVESLIVLHSKGYSHNDIKPENLMVDPMTKDLVLIDVGISTPLGSEINEQNFINSFWPPEVFKARGKFTTFVDSYSAGKFFIYLLNYGNMASSKSLNEKTAHLNYINNKYRFVKKSTNDDVRNRLNLEEFYVAMYEEIFNDSGSLEYVFENYRKKCEWVKNEMRNFESTTREPPKEMTFPEEELEINLEFFFEKLDRKLNEKKYDSREAAELRDVFRAGSLELIRYMMNAQIN